VCALALASLMACAATLPSVAAAVEGSSLQQLAEQEAHTQTATTATTATNGSSSSTTSTSHTTVLIVMGAAVLLLAGVGIVIVRDARKVAPATEADITEPRSGRDAAAMMRKRRARAKAARQQRKRNR